MRRTENMENDQDPPFPREPWQRLLQDGSDNPPETTDARIRAAARKAVAPRVARWWLPAALAASFLLAVLLVQLQFGTDDEHAVVTEADLAQPAATQAPAPTKTPAPAAYESAPSQTKESARSVAPFVRPPVEFAPEPEARVGGPEQDLRSASERVREETDDAVLPPVPEVDLPDGPTTATTSQRTAEQTGALSSQRAARQRTPEAWYAEIEALHKAGRTEEADAELARFEVAYPDWLKQKGLRTP